MRHVVGIFAGLAHRPPTARLTGHRTNVLGMAIPAALAQIDEAASLLQRRIVRGPREHPLELTQIGADHRGHHVVSRCRLEEGEDALGENREEEKEDPGHQGDETSGHSAGPPTGRGVPAPLGTGCTPSADEASAVIIRLMTSSAMPVSMLMPEKVRTTQ